MGNKKIQIIVISYLLAFCCNVSFGCCIISSLSSQVGVQELTGNNDGVEVDKFLIAAGFKPNSRNPYCAAFLMWGWKSCGLKKMGTAYAPSWFPNSRVIVSNQKGWENVKDSGACVFGLYFASHNRIAHVGYIQRVLLTTVITIEANTSPNQAIGEADRNGDGVWRKKRMKKGIYKVANWDS